MNDPAPAQTISNPRRRKFLAVIGSVFAVVALAWVLYWLLVLSRRETTNDAYVVGDQVAVAAQAGGTVIDVLAEETQRVDAGQVLVRLDPTDSQVALEHAASTLALSVRQVRQQGAAAEQSDANIASRQLDLQWAEAELARRQPLLEQHAIAPEELRELESKVALARAALQAAQGQSRAAHAPIEGVTAELNPAVQEARASFLQAWIAASRATVRAPVAGYLARRNVQAGQQVSPGLSLFTIVPLDKLWVEANFKEGQLRALHIGQPVRIDSDLYGGAVEYHGRIAGVGVGTGAAFSLLPAQNASGNWIKVVQRVPVRIALATDELARHPLRIGLSTTVNVDTKDRSGASLAAVPDTRAVASTAIYAADLQAAEQSADAVIRGEPLRRP
ncbi:MAG TPA: HlyD family efflux transporter periplasmic adaptor subunit [Steroidobacteraceae bacterium]|nr:HlyD family efflux transporter periplasmic adaptor subunit [Steroidobacteraceae bacterium]